MAPVHMLADACRHSQVEVSPASASDFKSAVVFEGIKNELEKKGAELVKRINGIFRFDVKNGDEKAVWIVDVKNGTGSVSTDENGKGDVTITMNDEDLLNVMLGKLNPQQAFFQGKLKIKGNMALAMKLRELQLKAKL